MNEFMERAVQLAAQNVGEGGQPFGAVIVLNNQIVAEGVNELHTTFDISGHAELLAMRRLQANIQSNDLSSYTMYASGEPCAMCLAAMYFAGLEQIYYCASVDDAEEVGLGKSKMIYKELQKPREQREIVIQNMPLEAGQENPMELWKDRL